MRRIPAIVTVVAALALITATPRQVLAVPCWYCQCVTNCSCLQGGTGSSCTASGSGCTVSGNCKFTSTPGGPLVQPRTHDRDKSWDAFGLQPARMVAVREAVAWTAVAPGRFVSRSCEGAIVQTRTTHGAAASLRALSSVLNV